MLHHLSQSPQEQSLAAVGPAPIAAGERLPDTVREELPESAGQHIAADAAQPEMMALIRRVRRKSVLAEEALGQLGQRHLSVTTVRALLSLLQGPFQERWRERLLAVWALGCAELEPQHRGGVATVLMEVLAGSRTEGEVTAAAWRRTIPFSGLIAGLTLIGSFISFGGLQASVYESVSIDAILMRLFASLMFALAAFGVSAAVLLPLVLPFSMAADTARNARIRAAAATTLGRLRQPKCIALLARTALDLTPGVRRAAEDALCPTLADLTAEHYGRLNPETVPNLCQLLHVRRHQVFAEHSRTEELMVSVLEALAAVGDSRALRLVENIATDGGTARVRQAAQQTLPILLERQQQETDRQSLLRGARLPETEPATLLRSVNEDKVAPETLLRPVSPETTGAAIGPAPLSWRPSSEPEDDCAQRSEA